MIQLIVFTFSAVRKIFTLPDGYIDISFAKVSWRNIIFSGFYLCFTFKSKNLVYVVMSLFF